MNEKLFDVCVQLSDEQRKADMKAPFRSIHGQWNHILLADRAWLGRFSGQPHQFQTLADELYADFDELRAERVKTDDAIDTLAAGLTPKKLNEILHFTMSDGTQRVLPLWVCVQHLFNHQTHHRGQITALLEQLGVDFGVTDFARMPGLME